MKFGQRAALLEIVEQRESLFKGTSHRHGNSAVHFDHGRRILLQQNVVKTGNLPPVRFCWSFRICVKRGDGSLDGISAVRAATERGFGETGAFLDLVPVPKIAILLLEQNKFAISANARVAPRIMEQ